MTETNVESIHKLAERLKPGTITLLTGMSGAGKSTLAFRVAEEVSKRRSVVVVWDEAYAIDGVTKGLGCEQDGEVAPCRRVSYIYETRRVFPGLNDVDLSGTDLLIVGHHYGLERRNTLRALNDARDQQPNLAVLLFGVFPPYVVDRLQRIEASKWLAEFMQGGVAATIGGVDAFAIVKPADGWTYSRSFRGRMGRSVQTVHFLKPEFEVVEIPKPTRRPW